MKSKLLTAFLLSAGMSLSSAESLAAPVSTAFTYQGSLSENGSPANGATEMSFQLWDTMSGGAQVGSTIIETVDVVDGVFSESLDFGAGSYSVNQALWLEIIVDGQSMGRTPLTASPYSLNTRGIEVDSDGRVALGLVINGQTLPPPSVSLDTYGGIRVREGQSNGPSVGEGLEMKYSNSANRAILEVRDRDAETSGTISMAPFGGNLAIGRLSARATLDVEGDAIFTNRVGINTTSPSVMLDVNGKIESAGALRVTPGALASGGAGLEFNYDSSAGGIISSFNRAENTPRDLRINPYGGMVGIGTISPQTTLDVNGAVTIRGGADIVEGFESACDTAFEPGTVLVIDPNNPGMLMCSEEAYDGKVAGVVSGANGIKPGIKLGQDGVMDGDIPVAMTGRVYVKCSTENGNIQPGDLLTTSSLSGHAMKSTDRDLSHGSVIGKAMTGLDESTGMVLVLVNLQ